MSQYENIVLRKIANGLTISRSILAIPVVILLGSKNLEAAWITLVIAGLTDCIDGWIARAAGGGSSFGAKIDPLSDKLLILGPIIWLTSEQIIPLWASWIFLARELIISNWRSEASQDKPASSLAKLKNLLQLTSVIFMLWPNNWGDEDITLLIHKIGWIIFWPALTISIISAIRYLKFQLIRNLN